MKRLTVLFNTSGLLVSTVCLTHCLLVLLIFFGLINIKSGFMSFLDNDINHLVLILIGFILASISLALNSKNDNNYLKILWATGSIFLFGSFFSNETIEEILIIAGASCLIMMHLFKLKSFE